MASYDVGDRLTITGTFTYLGNEVDPEHVRFKYWLEGYSATVLVYGVDADLVRVSEGVYSAPLPITAIGKWLYQMDDAVSDSVIGNVATKGVLYAS